MRRLTARTLTSAVLAMVILGSSTGCEPVPASAPWPAALDLLVDSTAAYPTRGADTIEVWVCDVPLATSDPSYNPGALRLPLRPTALTGILNRTVARYFAGLSHGLYRPVFVTGRVHSMTPAESPRQCLDAALDAAAPTSNGVLAVATAEQRAGAPGGFGDVRTTCTAPPAARCPASTTRRGAYVGASDFHPDWGPEPAVDLEEHEIGHLLGWPHSGQDNGEGHSSGIDLMSDSAAPRDFDSARRDGPDTLAVNRLAAGWLPASAVAVAARQPAPPDGSANPAQTFRLSPSTGEAGTRVLVLPVDDQRFLTVEYLPKAGLDSYLRRAGVTITLVDQSPAACGHTDPTPCTGLLRAQRTEVGTAPFYDLLTPSSGPWTALGWRVTVTGLATTATVRVAG